MFTRMLTDLERRRIKAYLKQDGERQSSVRKIVSRGKAFLPQIESDIALVKELLAAYERNKTK
jgi:hypothetical protein